MGEHEVLCALCPHNAYLTARKGNIKPTFRSVSGVGDGSMKAENMSKEIPSSSGAGKG